VPIKTSLHASSLQRFRNIRPLHLQRLPTPLIRNRPTSIPRGVYLWDRRDSNPHPPRGLVPRTTSAFTAKTTSNLRVGFSRLLHPQVVLFVVWTVS
jgi:hypothetical protein